MYVRFSRINKILATLKAALYLNWSSFLVILMSCEMATRKLKWTWNLKRENWHLKVKYHPNFPEPEHSSHKGIWVAWALRSINYFDLRNRDLGPFCLPVDSHFQLIILKFWVLVEAWDDKGWHENWDNEKSQHWYHCENWDQSITRFRNHPK